MISMHISTIFVVLAAVLPAAFQPPAQSGCRPSGELVRVRDLPELSGIATSRKHAGIVWAINDSGDPLITALDEKGAPVGRVRVSNAQKDDWEDVAVGPCAQRTCLYIADIGDNNGKRARVTIYRVAEPSPKDAATAAAEAFHARYPDGAHDAEALFVTGNSDLFIITKGDPGPIALYKFPRPLTPGAAMTLERVGAPPATDKVSSKDRPTAAAISQDGQWVAVRTNDYVAFHRAADLTAGRWREAFRTDLTPLKEPRGEGVAFGAGGTVFVAGEGGGLGGAGTFARLTCTFDR